VDSEERTIWIADAHRKGKRFIVRADEKLTEFLELEAAIRPRGDSPRQAGELSRKLSPMTTTGTTMLMTFLVSLSLLPASAVADDAAIKKQLVGSWKTPDGTIVLKENGVIIDPNNPGSMQRWDMNDDLGHHRLGVLHTFFEATAETDTTTGHNFFKIISLSETKLVIQDLYHGHHTGIWIRPSSER
jgi:hypothetical protein